VICEIRDRAATILRNAGYVAAVEVPEQRIADGNVRFQVLMARLTGIASAAMPAAPSAPSPAISGG
jgi:hemolysin activation/secretion protein